MAQVKFQKGLGIESLSGRIGNCIFYSRNGKQYVRRADKNDDHLPSIIDPSSVHRRSIIDPDPDLKKHRALR